MSARETPPPPHPAKFSSAILAAIEEVLATYLPSPDARVLDPFAGTGLVHALPYATFGIEIEPEWAAMHEDTIVGDALALPFDPRTFDAVVTSPAYGNRMADHHDARDGSTRKTYRHALGRMPTEGSSSTMHYGPEYRAFHEAAWREVWRVLRRGGLFVLNVKDFIRGGERVRVSAWHRNACGRIGFDRIETVTVPVRGMRYGENHAARVDAEMVYVFRKP